MVLLGVVTAVVGGVLRDIVCNEIPSAFSGRRPYAIRSYAGTWVLVAAYGLEPDHKVGHGGLPHTHVRQADHATD